MDSAIERAQSYFLVCAVVSKTTGYIIGPRMLRGNKNEADEQNGEEGDDDREHQRSAEDEDHTDHVDGEEPSEQASLLRQETPGIYNKTVRRITCWKHKLSSRFPDRVKQDLMAAFGSPFADVAVISASLGVILGLVPSFHRAFFNSAEEGGTFNAWLTSSVNNIGKLFTTFQIFVVGCTLGVSFERMRISRNSGTIPIRAIITIFLVRLVIWPA